MNTFKDVDSLYYRAVELIAKQQFVAAKVLFEDAIDRVDPWRDFVLYAYLIHMYSETIAVFMGESESALAALTRVLALGNDPALEAELHGRDAIYALTKVYATFARVGRVRNAIHARHIIEVLDAADALIEGAGYSLWRDATMEERAWVLVDLGRAEEGLEMMRQAIRLGRNNDESAPGMQLQHKQVQLMRLLEDLDQHDEGIAIARDLLETEALRSTLLLAVYRSLSQMLLQRGGDEDHWEARQLVEQGVTLAQRCGQPWQLGMLAVHFDVVDADSQHGRAVFIAQQLLDGARKLDTDDDWCAAYQAMAVGHANFHRFDKAEECLQKAEALARKLDANTARTYYQDKTGSFRARVEAKREELP